MIKFLILTSVLLMSAPGWAQGYPGEYPESELSPLEEGEFVSGRNLPPSDYEEVPREEQQFYSEPSLTDEMAPEEMAPEEIYEADEEYLE